MHCTQRDINREEPYPLLLEHFPENSIPKYMDRYLDHVFQGCGIKTEGQAASSSVKRPSSNQDTDATQFEN